MTDNEKESVEAYLKSDREFMNIVNKVLSKKSERITELEKENKKLKELLREIVEYLGQYCDDYPDCVIKAEVFIKETK